MAGNNVLANLFSWADGVKRRTSNPLQTIALGLQRGTEDLAAAAQDMDVGYGRNGMNSVLVSPQQRAEAQQRAADFGANMGMAGATRWQGPPRTTPTGMTAEQAQRIVANEDYLPWEQVAAAKKVLGIKEDSAAEIWAQMMAAKKGK